MTRRRRLTDHERELWARVARDTRRLRPDPDLAHHTDSGLRPDPGAPQPPPARSMSDNAGSAPPRSAWPAPPVAASVGRSAKMPLQMDQRIHARMTRGKLTPEARLDLHGMTLAQAHGALEGFIRSAARRGLRLVLVITGKGRGGGDEGPIPRRAGALRHEVPLWLRRPPLAALVMDTHEAHRRHGGAGALYVYLRRQRSA